MTSSLELIHMNRNLAIGLLLTTLSFLPTGSLAQSSELRLIADPAEVTVTVGQSVPLTVRVVDPSGQTVEIPLRFAAPRSAVRFRNGEVQGLEAGTYETPNSHSLKVVARIAFEYSLTSFPRLGGHMSNFA